MEVGAGTGVFLETGEWQGPGEHCRVRTPPSPTRLQSQETGPCSFVYKCRVAFGEQGWGQSVSKRKEKGLGVKKRGFACCSLLKSLCLMLCQEEK